MTITTPIAFAPSYRFHWTAWTEQMREQSLATFARARGIETIVPDTPHGAVQTLDEAEAAAEYFARQGVDGLILCPLNFGDERASSKVAEKLRVPTLLYATREPPASEDPSLARLSDSYCGNLSIAAGLHRRGIPFHYAGLFFPDEPALLAEVETFARAVAVVAGLRNARIGQIGARPSSFETVAYDEIAMARKFGQNVIYGDLADVIGAARGYADDDPRVQEAIVHARRTAPTLSVADDHLTAAAKLELALLEFWQKGRLAALAMQCWPTLLREMSLSPCALFGRLTERGMLTACEADVLGALSMLVQYRAALGENVPHFVDWTIQHRDDPNRLLAWHCGNAPPCLARTPQEVALRSRSDMRGALQPRPGDPLAGLYQFQLKPGRVTFCRLAEYDGAWKMLIAAGEILPSDETLAGTWSWVQVNDHARLYRALVEEGFIHHASMIHGDQVDVLRLVCKFLDIQPVVVV